MKEIVLKKLKEARGQYLSGEELGQTLSVSRTAVWKYIRELKEDGYTIQSSSKRGYCLVEQNDILNTFEIKNGLNTKCIGVNPVYLEESPSTNMEAKRRAVEGCEDGTVIVAGRQTQGRGRLGREWDSMNEKGVWMSVVLRPVMLPQDVQLVTLAASVAVVNAIKKATGISTGIKWPNDIILNNKKVCGILTEMSSEFDCINYIVIGIGLNVNQNEKDFNSEIRDKATSLKLSGEASPPTSGECRDAFIRSSLIKAILEELERVYELIKCGDSKSVICQWKKLSVTIGSDVRIISRNEYMEGKALDISHEGRLIVQCNNGEVQEVSSGEISVRGIMGYI